MLLLYMVVLWLLRPLFLLLSSLSCCFLTTTVEEVSRYSKFLTVVTLPIRRNKSSFSWLTLLLLLLFLIQLQFLGLRLGVVVLLLFLFSEERLTNHCPQTIGRSCWLLLVACQSFGGGGGGGGGKSCCKCALLMRLVVVVVLFLSSCLREYVVFSLRGSPRCPTLLVLLLVLFCCAAIECNALLLHLLFGLVRFCFLQLQMGTLSLSVYRFVNTDSIELIEFAIVTHREAIIVLLLYYMYNYVL